MIHLSSVQGLAEHYTLENSILPIVQYVEQHLRILRQEEIKQNIAQDSVITKDSQTKEEQNLNANIVTKNLMLLNQQTESFAANNASTNQAKQFGNQHLLQSVKH